MAIQIGRFGHRVTLQEKTQTDEAFGEETWSDISSPNPVWAKVRPMEGSEYFQGQQIDAKVTHVVSIRYRSDVTSHQRLLHDGRVLDIQHVINENEDDEVLHLHCEEKPAD